jgi:hypothetical protein
MIEVVMPIRESGPWFLKISSTSPVAADDENILINISGINSEEKPNCFVTPANNFPRKSRKPEARSTPTATIRPIRVGMICITV